MITIDEAIKVGLEMRNGLEIGRNTKEFDALGLLIEAGKRFKQLREKTWPTELYYLPGETEE